MEYLAAAELVLIAGLVWLLNRARDHEVQAILDVMAANEVERAELLNAARNAGHLLRAGATTPAPSREVTEEELERAKNWQRIGTVEPPA